jgi:hypothetical protein
MANKTSISIDGVIDCACVIHSTGYSWDYVEKLYNMLSRHLDGGIRFHVYTEQSRPVPPHMIKHSLTEWPGISGYRKSWWYKLQLFNPEHHRGNLLYLDLDLVLIRNLNWIRQCDPAYFWSIRDFRYLQKPHLNTVNSSMMWWNVSEYSYVWQNFAQGNVEQISRRYPGDQDYIAQTVEKTQQKFFDSKHFQSYRWQCLDGGFDFQRRLYRRPDAGCQVGNDTAAIIFHGKPKPHEVLDPLIVDHWQ